MRSEDLKRRARVYALGDAPGHLLRRCQQRAVDLFAEEVGEDGPTPRQFAVLLCVYQNPGASQNDLVRATGIDRSTLAGIVRRLAGRGLLSRRRTEADRRANAVGITAAGERALLSALDAVERAQSRILAPVAPGRRPEAMALLVRLADGRGPR